MYLGFIVCEGGVARVFMAIGYALIAAKIAIPIVLLVMGVMDFMKAVFGADPKSFSTSIKTLIQRVIAGVIIFFVPTMMYIILGFIDGGDAFIDSNGDEGFAVCNQCMYTPTKCCSLRVNGHGACEVSEE